MTSPRVGNNSLFILIVFDITGSDLVNISGSYLYMLLKHIFIQAHPSPTNFTALGDQYNLILLTLISTRTLQWNYYYHHYLALRKPRDTETNVTLCVSTLRQWEKSLRPWDIKQGQHLNSGPFASVLLLSGSKLLFNQQYFTIAKGFGFLKVTAKRLLCSKIE